MKKYIFIYDEIKNCSDCPCYYYDNDYSFNNEGCNADISFHSIVKVDYKKKPDNCPLKEEEI